MAKYLLLKHYRGAPAAINDVPMDQWTPDEVEAHIRFMNEFAARLEGTGEFVDGQALSPDGVWVRYDGAVAIGEADGAPAGLVALAEVEQHIPRHDAVAAYLHEKNGELELAARLYAEAARNAPNLAERDHQTRQAARVNELLRHGRRIPEN